MKHKRHQLSNELPSDRIKLVKTIKALSDERQGGKIWLMDIEAALKDNQMALGKYFTDGGRDKAIRRIKLQMTKCKTELVLSYVKKHQANYSDALKVVEEKVPWNKLKKIDMIPDLGGDVDTILQDF